MLAVLEGFVTSGTTAVLEEFVSATRRETLPGEVTHLLAVVPARQG